MMQSSISFLPPFRMTVITFALMFFGANNVLFFVRCDSANATCEEDTCTALDSCEQSFPDKSLRPFIMSALDEEKLWSFPVLRGNGQVEIDIAKEIWNNKSEEFGFALLSAKREYKIAEIIQEHPRTANRWIILEWLKGKGKHPITSKTLIDALHEIGHDILANEMHTTCEILKIMDVPYRPASVKEYSQFLSQEYEKESVMNSTQWLPRMFEGRDVNINFVDLDLKESGDFILLVDLIDGIQSGTRILFLGRPGVGKTTIIRHLAKIWTHSEHFYLVVKVHLGVAGRIDSLNTLLKANAHESLDSYDINVISDYISKTHGQGVCILLDGFDEYAYYSSDYVAGLIHGGRLDKSVVIMTSRTSAAEVIQNFFNRKIEIIGFGDNSVRLYLEQLELPDDKYQLIYQYFNAHPYVREMCYLPLHLSMLVYVAVVTTDGDKLSLGDTETELYSDFLTLTMAQYENVRHPVMAESLIQCFDDGYQGSGPFVCSVLRTISENAFNAIMSGESTFNSSSFRGLPNGANISAEIEALSLFKTETLYNRHGYKIHKFSYSHPTFQEFLAAFHLTTIPRNEQLNYTKHGHMHESYMFFLGLIGRKLNRKYDDKAVSQLFGRFSATVLSSYNKEVFIIKCAHEARKNTDQFVTFLRAVGVISNSNSINLQVYKKSSHECWYVGYVLTHSSVYELRLDEYSEVRGCVYFIINYLKHDPGKVKVSKLALGDYTTFGWPWFNTGEALLTVLDFLPAFENELIQLELPFLRFENSSSVLQLGETLKSFKKLKILALSVSIDVIREGHFETVLRSLTILDHLKLGVIHDDKTVPEDILEFRSLKHLQSFTLCFHWDKDRVDVNMAAMLGGLMYLTQLESLTIHLRLYGGFRTDGATELLQGIEKVSSSNLTLYLDLCWGGGIGNVTIEELAAVLNNLNDYGLKKLSLCVDFTFTSVQGNRGPIGISEGLKGLTELQELSLDLTWELQGNDDVDEAAVTLADGLKHLCNLRVLKLSLKQNGSCSEIVEMFKSLTLLKELDFKWDYLFENTNEVKLFEGLKELKKLRALDLSWNTVGDNEMVALTEALKYMNHLNVLDLSHNKIGDAGIQLLANAIDFQHLTCLQVIRLAQNEFSCVGAEILSQKALMLLKLQVFDLGVEPCSADALSANESYTEPCDFNLNVVWSYIFSLVAILVGGFFVGGFLCHFALKSGYQAKEVEISGSPALGISDSLALGIFSTSSAWKLEKLRRRNVNGEGTVIAIFDTAINLQLPAFCDKYLRGEIRVVDLLPQFPISSIEHGNVCASVAIGQYFPTTAVPSGVAPGAHLILYRVAEGGVCYNDSVFNALDDVKAKVESGDMIDIVSISYDLGENDKERVHMKVKALTEMGVVVVAAAGNGGGYEAHAAIPAFFEEVISVGALDKNGFKSRFTSCGRVDVFAPGEDIPTPSLGVTFGTSFATPAISGVLSLLKQCAKYHCADNEPSASSCIHNVEILRTIFNKPYMTTTADNGQVDVFDPVSFLLDAIDDPNKLNEIINRHLSTHADMELN